VYSGKAQTGVAAGPYYSVKGGSATNAGSYVATLNADANHVFSGGASTAYLMWSISKATIAVPKAMTGLVYSGKPQTGVASGAGYTIFGGSATDAGTYTAIFVVDDNYAFSDGKAAAVVSWSIAKAANPLKLAKATRTVKAKNVEKKNIVVRGAKLVKAGQGTMTYSIKPIAKKYKKFKKHVGINKKTGKITIMKGCPKGTFKVTVKATAKGNANYKSATRNAVVTIKVK
jgi:hypothetical protein